MGFIKDAFGGGKAKTNWKDLERYFQLQDEMNQKDSYGLFSNRVWRDGAMHHEVNPEMEGAMSGLMSRFGSGDPYEGYSSPSGLSQLRDSRMAHQFERMGQQPPLGQPGGMPGSQGPSIQPMPGNMPPGQGGPPPGAMLPPPPGEPPGGLPGMPGMAPGGSIPGRGGAFGEMAGRGMTSPYQQQAMQAAAQGGQGVPYWAQNQRFGGMLGAGEAAIDTMRRNRDVPDDQREGVMRNMFSALMGR